MQTAVVDYVFEQLEENSLFFRGTDNELNISISASDYLDLKRLAKEMGKQLDNSFYLVVFDPPHIEQLNDSQITKKYGSLQGDWREMLRKGFIECFRVLKPNGVLIFKWNEVKFPIKEILKLTDEKPLFGHKSGIKMQTHWVTFIKSQGVS